MIVSDAERQRLERGDVVVRMLPAEGSQLAVLVATRLQASPDGLAAWTGAMDQLRRSRFVLASGRFSDPPDLSDLEDLHLDESELDALRACRPGDCGMKLSAQEIQSLRAITSSGGASVKEAIDSEFRRLLLARINAYRAGGLAVLPASADRSRSSPPDQAFASIMAQSPYMALLPEVSHWLRKYPRRGAAHVESFFYWSKEYYGAGKPIINITHVGIGPTDRGQSPGPAVVFAKQIFATHYFEGALGLTLVLGDAASGTSYLVYIHRSEIDLLRGIFGGFARSALETGLRRQAPQTVRELRKRLESRGLPESFSGMRIAQAGPNS